MSEADSDARSAEAPEAPASGESLVSARDEGEAPASCSGERAPDSAVPSSGEAPRPKRRSSIRPVAPDWRPPPRAMSEPPRPMVVVYSGDSERPSFSAPPDTESAETVRPPPAAPLPFLLKRDLAAPALPSFADVSGQGALVGPSSAPSSEPSSGELASTHDRAAEVPFTPAQTADDAPGVALASDAVAPLRDAPSPVERRPSRAPSETSTRRRGLVVLAAALLVGASTGVVIQRLRARGLADRNTQAQPALVANVSAAASAASAPAPVASAANPAPLVSVEEPAAVQARPTSTLVVLDVVPPDAKVAVKGVQQHGPPFVFDIPPGKRIAVEVMRRGYVTRRAVLDGSAPRVTVGLLSVKVAHWRDNLKASVPGAKPNPQAVKEPEAPVQSGL